MVIVYQFVSWLINIKYQKVVLPISFVEVKNFWLIILLIVIKILNANSRIKMDKKIDELVFEWFTQQRVKQIPTSGPILQEKARQVAEQLAYSSETFKASNGWLEKFRNRHAISLRTINGESASVDNSSMEE